MDVGVKDFEDIAVYFSEEEWSFLGTEQKRLYKDVMMENYRAVRSLGEEAVTPDSSSVFCTSDISRVFPFLHFLIILGRFYLKPEVISRIERGKEPCVQERGRDDGDIPFSYFIVKPEILANLPEVLNDEDEDDWIYLEIDSDSDEPRDRESCTSDSGDLEDGGLSDCVYVESEDETLVEKERSLVDLEEEEDDDASGKSLSTGQNYEISPNTLFHVCADCVCVEAETVSTTGCHGKTLVKDEDLSDEDQGIEIDDEDILPDTDLPAHWETKTLNGHDIDRIEESVSPENLTANKNQDWPRNNLLNVWYVKRVENNPTSHKEVIVPGTPRNGQRKEEDSVEEDAEQEQITDLELLCPMCPEIFTNVSKFFEHQKVHEPKTPVCPECGARFSDSSALERHLLLHIEEKIQVCQECGQCFSSRSALEIHLKTHKGDKQWPCPDCGKFLYSKSGLERHQLLHVRDKPVPCPQCGKCFTKQSNFEMHLRAHAGEAFYPCTECEKLFSSRSACDRHIRAHTKERPHGCPECGKRFLYNGCLIKHMRVHTGEKPFVCPECGRRFAQSSSLNSHRRLHEDEKPYVCPECKACFSKKFNFDTHLKIHAKERLLAEIAQMRGENGHLASAADAKDLLQGGKPDIDTFEDGSYSQSHSMDVAVGNGRYDGERPAVDVSFRDGPCQKVIGHTLGDETFEEIPLNEKQVRDVATNGGAPGVVPWKEGPVRGITYKTTPVIDVSFNNTSAEDASYHSRFLGDVWPIEDLSFIDDPFIDISSYDQSIGDDSFLRIRNAEDILDLSLIHDPRSHVSFSKRPMIDLSYYRHPASSRAEEKQHVCPECGKSFPYNGCLVKHLRTHTGEKPFACTECGKCFAQTSTLNCHKRTHTGERPYICPQCGKGFTSQSHVVRHQAIHNVRGSFLCNGCGKVFSLRSYLIKHQKRTACSQFL
ncbi:uncharacterized protein [Engystomops pustulosus]|uniref:uncharacterized protein n=1 Tax=Engystomops pustulosus TaxID=76066 RepID=UPI003AFAB10B